MIIKQEDIAFFNAFEVVGEQTVVKLARLHKPSGVFFTHVSDSVTMEIIYFLVGSINAESEIKDKETFEGNNQESFFKAVDYFESLIEQKIPQPKPESPSMGIFFFIKGQNSVAEAFGQKVVILREDIEKVFTPPIKKPYGRLDMTVVDNADYDIIKSKFALNFNESETLRYSQENNIEKGNVIAYDMTPYSNDANPDSSEPTPSGVNDDSLSLDQIEGEDEQNMQGSNEDESKDDSSEDKSNSDKDPTNNGDEEDGEDDGTNDSTVDDDKNTESDKAVTATVDSKDEVDESKNIEELDDLAKAILGDSINIIAQLNKAFKVENVITNFRKQQRLLDALNVWTEAELKQTFYKELGFSENTTKSAFLETVKEKTKTYFQE